MLQGELSKVRFLEDKHNHLSYMLVQPGCHMVKHRGNPDETAGEISAESR